MFESPGKSCVPSSMNLDVEFGSVVSPNFIKSPKYSQSIMLLLPISIEIVGGLSSLCNVSFAEVISDCKGIFIPNKDG